MSIPRSIREAIPRVHRDGRPFIVAAVALAVRVSALDEVVLAGLNVAVTPLGRPEADRLTLLLKPLSLFTVIVLVPPAAACVIASVDGAADSEKSAVAVAETVSVIVVVCVSEPDVPVIVTAFAPVVAVELAANVTVVPDAELVGLNAAVTPIKICTS